MSDIVLATLNARYAHASFGLRYLLANLGELQPRASLLEFDVNQRPVDVLETILSRDPKIVGLGGYKNDSKFSVGRNYRDALSAALMISNDRIYSKNASMLLVYKDE